MGSTTTTTDEPISQQPTTRIEPHIGNMEITNPPDDLNKTREVAITIGLFIAATSAALVVNAISPARLLFLLIPYDILLNLSLFIGIGLALYSIMNRGNNTAFTADEVATIRKLMMTGLTTTSLTLVLRGMMVHPYSYPAWYVYFIVTGMAFLYLWTFWKLRMPFAN